MNNSTLAVSVSLRYIVEGEAHGYQHRPGCAGRARWWALGQQAPFDFVELRFRDKRNWNPINETPSLLAGDSMFIGNWKDRTRVAANNAVSNSTLSVLISEICGRVNLSNGLLTTYGPEMLRFDCLDAATLNEDELPRLTHAFDVLKNREVTSIFEEVHQRDWWPLDDIIFDVLNLTRIERDPFYEEVSRLVENRLSRANSISRRGYDAWVRSSCLNTALYGIMWYHRH